MERERRDGEKDGWRGDKRMKWRRVERTKRDYFK